MVLWTNATIRIYKYHEKETVDIYGEKEYEYLHLVDVLGDFQPNSPSESIEVNGTIYNDTYKAYLPIGTPIDEQCKVKVNGKWYDILGTPQVYNNIPQTAHVKLTLTRCRQ